MSSQIHPTAVVAPNAEIGEGVTIGAYSVIGANARIDAGTWIDSHVVIDGPIRIGRECQVYSFASLGKSPQDLKYDGGAAGVVIGDRCIIREYVTVHCATQPGAATVVGDDCFFLAYCHVAHDCTVGNRVIMSNGFTLAGHVTMGDNVVCGGLGGVHQFTRVGSMAMISAMCKVVQDVVPYCLVDGQPSSLVSVNKIGLERNGKSPEAIAAVTKAYKTLFRSGLLREDAIRQAREEYGDVPEVEHMLSFMEADSKRGITAAHSTPRR